MILIGLAGKKLAGKDTAGSYLVEEHGFARLSFAAPLKESFAALFNVPVKYIEKYKSHPAAIVRLDTPDGAHHSMTLRVALQRYGTEAHREIPGFGRAVWTDMLFRLLPEDGRFVITDSRFDNECGRVQEAGGVVVYIDRDTGDDADTHASEQKPTSIDFTINNNGTIDELHSSLDLLVRTLEQKEEA